MAPKEPWVETNTFSPYLSNVEDLKWGKNWSYFYGGKRNAQNEQFQKQQQQPVTWAKVSFFPVYVSVESYK